MGYLETITKEQLNQLPLSGFEGNIITINNVRDLDKVVSYLERQPFLGFDTETRPSFKKGKVNEVALLQLATATESFLFRLNQMGLPERLCDLLENSNVQKVGLAILDDIRGLRKLHPFKPSGFVELQEVVKEYGIQDLSLKKVTGIVLDFRISKRQQLSNWESEELTEAQNRYAATDAWVALGIYQRLKQGYTIKNM